MSNRLKNAGFLELGLGYESNFALAIDEAVRGAPGRTALIGSANIAVAGGILAVQNAGGNYPSLTSGQTAEISLATAAFINGAPVTPDVYAIFLNAGSNEVGRIRLTVRPAEYSQAGVGVLGLRETFGRVWARVTAPPGSNKLLLQSSVITTSNAASVAIAYLKPFIGTPTGAQPLVWDPGDHTNTDLKLPLWPALRPFRNPAGMEPVANRVAFSTATGINKTRLLCREPPVNLRGSIRCSPTERETLEAFYRAGHDRFWVVRPDTDQLCVATWLPDGAPRPSAFAGLTTIMDVGLQLTVA